MGRKKAEPNTYLSNQIRQRRKNLNISASELGEMIHVSRKTIEAWENPINERKPDIDTIVKLGEVFNCDPSELISKSELVNAISVKVDDETSTLYKKYSNVIKYLDSIGYTVEIRPRDGDLSGITYMFYIIPNKKKHPISETVSLKGNRWEIFSKNLERIVSDVIECLEGTK